MPPFFSVIIPAYNCAHLISETFDSVLDQEFKDFEIIVVNDGSTDNTAEVIESYNNSHNNNISIIHQENKGEGGGRNRGIFAARGTYIAFLDQDDLWFPCTLQIYYEVIKANNSPSILIASGQEFTSVESISELQQDSLRFVPYGDYFSVAGCRYIPAGTPGTVVKTEDAKRVKGLSEDRVIGIDQEFFLKLGTSKGVVHILSPITVAIRRHDGNLQKNTHMAIKGIFLFINKELKQCYPGGRRRAWARRAIISRLARTTSMKSLQDGLFFDSLNIYCKTLRWNIRLCRLRYLTFFPFIYLYKRLVVVINKKL
jgi:glycosyltransferase involved in cell wall biosynthesis